jgi:hypothetical protein
MRVVLKVSSSNQDWDGGCAFAIVELSEALATLAQRRIAALREQKNVDPDVDEVYYWAASCVECYFSPWGDLICGDEEAEGTGLALAELLDELQVEEKEIVTVPDSFRVPASQIAAVECEQMIIRPDSIAFMAIPKHSSVYVQTAEIPLATLEVAAKASKART